jgi:shikimate dehydrogenase
MLLLDAERLGIPFINGLPMLTAQAKRSAELFCGKTIGDSIIDEITHKIAFRMKNIVLVGMPGSGKSTLGQIISGEMGRTLLDTDCMITEREGRTPASIIENDSEAAFRLIETSVVSNAGAQSGCVIATGGGIITRRENFGALRQNGFIIFINRPIDMLDTGSRPLSGGIDVRRALYEARMPLYREICDIEIDGSGSITEVAETLRNELQRSGFEI